MPTIYNILRILIIFFISSLLTISSEASSLPIVKEPSDYLKSSTIKYSFNEYLNKPNVQIAYEIIPRDTLYSITLKHYASTDPINKLGIDNYIKNPSVDLKAGKTIYILNPKFLGIYKVKPGDTMFNIIQTYFNVEWYTNYVQTFNGITDPKRELKAGMKISIPLTNSKVINHTVQPGETLFGIISKHLQASIFQKLIMENNKITDSTKIRVGSEIKIPNPFYTDKIVLKERISEIKGSYYIKVSKSKNTLTIFNNQNFVRSFPVATGKNIDLTPMGTFKVVNKIKDPWYSPKGLRGGTTQNPLGTRWLGLSVPNTNGTKYGIHGTNNPSSIGKHVSLGCIRMNNKDVQWLYDHIPTGTLVVIKN